MKKIHRPMALIAVVLIIMQIAVMAIPGPSAGSEEPQMGPVPDIGNLKGRDLEEGFVANEGQWDQEVIFGVRSVWGSSFFTRNGIKHNIVTEDGASAFFIAFEGSNGGIPQGISRMDHVVNFILGKDESGWASSVECYEEILYEDIWPGVDINYYLRSGSLKYDLIISGSADPASISFEVQGAVDIFSSGRELEIRSSNGISLWDLGLKANYENGEILEIDFVKRSHNSFGFNIEKEMGRKIIIDPLLFSTSIGGSGSEDPVDFKIDDAGDLYLFGNTYSFDYPNTTGAYDNTPAYVNIPQDNYISKISSDGKSLIFSTYFGGWTTDVGCGMDVDENHDIYITGWTYQWDFPITDGAFQEDPKSGSPSSVYVTKFASNGSSLIYSTFLSSESIDIGGDVAVRDGEAYVACYSLGHEFPSPWGLAGGVHGMGFVVGMSRDGRSLVDLMGIDGYHGDYIDKIIIDNNKDVVVSGISHSKDCPYTPHSVQYPAPTAASRSFVAKFTPNSTMWDFISIFGSTVINNIKVDQENNIYFTGYLKQDGSMVYPTTPGAINKKYDGSKDLFITKIDPKGTELLSSAMIGAKKNDIGGDIDIDAAGNIYCVGMTYNLSTIESGFNSPHGKYDSFIMKLNNNLSRILNLTYIGGSGNDSLGWCKLVGESELMVHGYEGSVDLYIENQFNRSSSSLFLMDMTISSIPSEPVQLIVQENISRIDLQWSPPIDKGNLDITGYLVYRGNSSVNLTKYVIIDNTTSYTDNDTVCGIDYFYGVAAVNHLGEGPICEPGVNISTSVPSPPIKVEVSIEIGAMTINFDPPVDDGGAEVLGYIIYRDGAPLVELDPRITSYIDREIERGVFYNYTMTASNKRGESEMAGPIVVKSRNTPSAPRGLVCYPGIQSIDLRWGEPMDDGGLEVEMYLLHRGTNQDNMSLHKMLPFDTVSFKDFNVQKGIQYYYKVEALNQVGLSPPTNVVSGIIYDIPQPPAIMDAIPGWRSIEITWTDTMISGGSEKTGYNIYHGYEPGELLYLTSVSGDNTSFLHEGLMENRLNYYFITTSTTRGESIPSVVVYTRPIVDPSPPEDVNVYYAESGLVIGWKAPSSNGNSPIISYIIFRGSAGDQLEEIGSVLGTQRDFLDTSLTREVQYIYGVKAVNNNGISELSSLAAGEGKFIPDPPASTDVETSFDNVTISWEPPVYTGGSPILIYRVHRREPSGQEVLLDSVSPDERTYVDDTALFDVPYTYYVRSVNQIGASGPGREITAELLGIPSSPLNLNAEMIGGDVVITWDTPASQNGPWQYNVYRKDPLGEMELIDTTDVLIFVDLSLGGSGVFEYRVAAVNDAGESEKSSPATIEVLEPEEENKEAGTLIYLVPGAILILLLLLMINVVRYRRADGDDLTGGEE